MKTTQLKSLTISTQVLKQIKVLGVELHNKYSQKTHQKLIIKGPLGEQSLITPHFIKVTMEGNTFILNNTIYSDACPAPLASSAPSKPLFPLREKGDVDSGSVEVRYRALGNPNTNLRNKK